MTELEWHKSLVQEQLKVSKLRIALFKCQRRFEGYVRTHMAKKTQSGQIKAEANQEMVEICKEALYENLH